MDSSHRRWIACSAILCAGLIYVYPLTLGTPLLDPDEGLHAAISQEMVEGGDYVTPRFLHEPFLDKPILYFAAQATSLQIFGMNEAAIRAPGLLFGLLGAVTAAILARRLFDPTTALLSLLVSLTSIIPFALAQAAAHDVALVPWTNLLLLCWWGSVYDETRRRRIACTIVAGLFVALALLTKGLIGVAVVGVGFAAYIAITRQQIVRAALSVAASLTLGGLVSSPWFIAMEQSSPGYLHYYFIERHLRGYVTNTQQHGHAAWYFYLPLIVGGALPWVFYVVPGIWQSLIDRSRGRQPAQQPTMFLICWLVGGLLFLTTANSKLITYALPLFPAVAILVGHACKRFTDGELDPKLETVFARTFGLSCALGVVFPFAFLAVFDRYVGVTSSPAAYFVAALAAAVSLAALVLQRRRQPARAIAVGAVWYGLVFVATMTWPMQPLAEQLSQRALAHEFAGGDSLPKHVVLTGERVASVIFYLTPEQRRQLHPNQITELQMTPVHGWNEVPEDTLLAVETWAWDRWPNPVMRKSAHDLGLAGDFHLLVAHDSTPKVAAKKGAPLQ